MKTFILVVLAAATLATTADAKSFTHDPNGGAVLSVEVLTGDSFSTGLLTRPDLQRPRHLYGLVATDRPLTDRYGWRPGPISEPTEQGNQYVIPGCEKDRSRSGKPRMELF